MCGEENDIFYWSDEGSLGREKISCTDTRAQRTNLSPHLPQFQQSQQGPTLSSLPGRTVDGPNGGAADEVGVLLVHSLQLHPHLEPVHLGRGRLLLEAPAR
jgi:hypothetical protein